MRKLWRWILTAALFFFLAAPVLAADQSALSTPIIAIIDVQRILDESLAAKNVQQQLEAANQRRVA